MDLNNILIISLIFFIWSLQLVGSHFPQWPFFINLFILPLAEGRRVGGMSITLVGETPPVHTNPIALPTIRAVVYTIFTVFGMVEPRL